MNQKERNRTETPSRERLNFRLIVAIPVIFLLMALAVAFLSMFLTRYVLAIPPPASRELLILQLWLVGMSLAAALVGALLANMITTPVRKAIGEAQKMLQYVKQDPPPIESFNELRALSELFDQARVSFLELVQAREVLDNINDGVLAIDRNGRVAGMNVRACEMLAISPTDREKTLEEILGDGNRRFFELARSSLEERTERIDNSLPFALPDGRKKELSVKASPLKMEREPEAFLGVILIFREQVQRMEETPEIIGESSALTEILELLPRIAATDSTVLILGESGTGKELIADAIQRLSERSEKPYIKLNCAAIPEGLLESELFGHEKGSFTGADKKKAGKFEQADGGTIFLDEIGDMSASTQSKVLRVLQQKEITPVGGSATRKVDVRIIAATNKNLYREVEESHFREDLFHRLNVMTLQVPPLRKRKSDIPFLVEYFLEGLRDSDVQAKSLSRGALERLVAYDWPGNIRELKNVVERAALLSDNDPIQASDLFLGGGTIPFRDEAGERAVSDQRPLSVEGSLNETLQAVERELIVNALKKTGGVQVEAAKLLGLNNKNLWAKIRKHNIDVDVLKGTGE